VDKAADGWHLSGIVDWPAMQYADAEYELAYLQWSEAAETAFFETYHAARLPRVGYELRRLFYWLHTHMLHVWLECHESERQKVVETAAELVKALRQIGKL
jgi:fructosamine-3-kinase